MEQGNFFGEDDEKPRRKPKKRDPRKTEKDFVRFHKAHPEVYDIIVKQMQILWAQGYRHYGMKAFFERIRWHEHIAPDVVEEFKINNNYAPLYARMVMRLRPEFDGFFAIRERGRKGKHQHFTTGKRSKEYHVYDPNAEENTLA